MLMPLILIFQDFAVGLSESLHGSIHEKLKWTFRLYDVDSDGLLRKEVSMKVYVLGDREISFKF